MSPSTCSRPRPAAPRGDAHPIAALLVAILAFCTCPDVFAQPRTTWHLAEGATGRSADFVEDILIANPSASPARVRISFLPVGGATLPPYDLTVGAASRATVRVNTLPGLADAEFSATVESLDGIDLVVERSMYWPSTTRRGGHNSLGVTTPAARWFLAEGSTGFFNAFVLIANPDATRTARVKVTFLKPGGGTIAYRPDPSNASADEIVLPPRSRYNVWVNAEVAELSAGSAFSTVVEAINGVGIIAERAMYWNTNRVWEGGHNSIGVTQSSLSWLFAEGTTKTAPGLDLAFNTFLLLSNPSASAARARVRFFTEKGTPPLERTYPLPPYSRENVWVNVIPELANKDFSIGVDSLPDASGAPAQPIVAERAVYWGPTTPPLPNWVDGHSTPGLPAEATAWVFAEGLEDRFADSGAINFDTYFLISNASPTDLALRGTFVREDGTGIVREFTIAAESRFTMAGFQFPELTNQRFAAFFESLNGVPFVAERAVYWGVGDDVYYGGHGSTGVPWNRPIATPPAPPAASVTAVAPSLGPTSGGTTLTITGANFTSEPTSVTVGGVPARSVAVVNANTITAVTGSLATTNDVVADVVVTNGNTGRTLPGAFTYLVPRPPTVSSISPRVGRSTGGETVTMTGTNFVPGTIVSFGCSGGVTAPTTTVVSPTELRVVTPGCAVPSNATELAVNVTVSAGGFQATAPAQFTYSPFTATDTILAFGDSITDGVTSIYVATQTGLSIVSVGCGGCARSYPVQLTPLLQQRYTGQTIRVTEAGIPGETTYDGRKRFTSAIGAHDLAIVLEGTNDVSGMCAPTADIINNLRAMIQAANAAGRKALVGTLPPVLRYDVVEPCTLSPFDHVLQVNTRIRALATDPALDVKVVDIYPVVSAHMSPDNVHPTDEGYRRIAAAFRDAIVQHFESILPVVP